MPIPGAQLASTGKKKKNQQQSVNTNQKEKTNNQKEQEENKQNDESKCKNENVPQVSSSESSKATKQNQLSRPEPSSSTKVLTRAQHPLASGVSRLIIQEELLELDPVKIHDLLYPSTTTESENKDENDNDENNSNTAKNTHHSVVELARKFLPNLLILGTNQEKQNIPLCQQGIPRGLINGSNACFVASVLQMLLALPPFCCVCLSAAAAYARKTVYENNGQAKKRRGGDSQEPTASILGRWMMTCWQPIPTAFPLPVIRLDQGPLKRPGQEGYKKQNEMTGAIQQDAHEFLQLLLSRIDDDCKELGLSFSVDDFSKKQFQEQLTTEQSSSSKKRNKNSNIGWVAVGKGNEKKKIRKNQKKMLNDDDDEDDEYYYNNDDGEHIDVDEEEVARRKTNAEKRRLPSHMIFGGEMHIQVRGDVETTQLDEPFLMLMVHVSGGKTISECISSYLARQLVETASSPLVKMSKIARPPKYALFVHVTRWAMSREGEILKLDNAISLDTILNLKYTGSCPQNAGSAKFRLKSVLCHRGRMPSSGHYVTYLYNYKLASSKSGKTTWIDDSQPPEIVCANDTKVSSIGTDQSIVEKDSPYLLCYVRE